jgi:peptidoglycan/LPS O-acetylase OafA/YrhL
MSYGYIEEYFGMGEPETTVGRLGVFAAQFAIGAAAAGAIDPQNWKKTAPLGGVAAVAACHLVDTLLPFTGVFYYLRGLLMVPGGVGALIGLYQKQQLESEAVETLGWAKKLRTGEA